MKPILGAILSVSSTVLNDEEKRLLELYNPLGVALFSRNLKTKSQIKALGKNIREVIGRDDVLIALDEEGGRVDRLKDIRKKELASQAMLGKINSKKITKAHALLIAEEMCSVGANLNFAPVLDLDYRGMTTALKSRTFSSGPKKTANLGRILWQTYADAGICPCIKHLPGHGRAQIDPHLYLPAIEEGWKGLQRDFEPFILNKDCPVGMAAHILLKAVDDNLPITFSKKGVEEVIRRRIGFGGFLISDALEMKALKGDIGEKTQNAFEAGLDAVCYCMGDIKGLREVCKNAKFLSEKSFLRFEAVRQVLKTHKAHINNVDLLKEKYYSATSPYAEEEINYDATEVLLKLKQGEK